MFSKAKRIVVDFMDILGGLSEKVIYRSARGEKPAAAVIDSIDAKLNECISNRPSWKRRCFKEL